MYSVLDSVVDVVIALGAVSVVSVVDVDIVLGGVSLVSLVGVLSVRQFSRCS